MPSPLSAPAGASVPQTILTTTQLASFVSPTISAPRTIAPYGWGNRSVSHGTSPSAGLMPNAAMIGNGMFDFTPGGHTQNCEDQRRRGGKSRGRKSWCARPRPWFGSLHGRNASVPNQAPPNARQSVPTSAPLESALVSNTGTGSTSAKPQGMRRRRRLDRMEASWESFIVLMVKRRALYVADAWHLFPAESSLARQL